MASIPKGDEENLYILMQQKANPIFQQTRNRQHHYN